LNISYLRQENKKYIGIMKHMCTIRNIEQYSKLLTRKVQAVQGRFRRYKEGSGGTRKVQAVQLLQIKMYL